MFLTSCDWGCGSNLSELKDLIPAKLRKKLETQIVRYLAEKQKESEFPFEINQQVIFNEAYRIALDAIIRQLDVIVKEMNEHVQVEKKAARKLLEILEQS